MRILRRTITATRALLVSFLLVLVVPWLLSMGGYLWAVSARRR